MIYIQIHDYTDPSGLVRRAIVGRVDQPDDTWIPFDVPCTDWLYLTCHGIEVYTQAEMDATAIAAKEKNDVVLAHIVALEATQPRIMREVIFRKEGAIDRLATLDSEIAELRTQLL